MIVKAGGPITVGDPVKIKKVFEDFKAPIPSHSTIVVVSLKEVNQ